MEASWLLEGNAAGMQIRDKVADVHHADLSMVWLLEPADRCFASLPLSCVSGLQVCHTIDMNCVHGMDHWICQANDVCSA